MEFIKRNSLVIFLLLLGGIAVAIYFLWWPKYQEFGANVRVVENKGIEIENKKNYLSDIQAKINILSDYEEDMAKINSAIPIYDFSEISLFSYAQKTASENGLVLENLSFSSPDQTVSGGDQLEGNIRWKLSSLSFNVSLLGSYSSLKNFLSAVYLNSRVIEVNSISFSSLVEEKEDQPKDIYNFDLQLSAKYYVKDKSQDASAVMGVDAP